MSFHSTLGENRAISSSTWAVTYAQYSADTGTLAIMLSNPSIGGGVNVQSSPPE
jgi:hypothetical protein